MDPTNSENRVITTRINITEGVPSTRWGHAAATNNGKLYILGGRNDQDVCDLHEFDPVKMKWKEIEFNDPKPKPRRRHSAIILSGSLIMFGGFDGSFFNDINILDLE
jgi:N-acetylneuraminic acid mutarotase